MTSVCPAITYAVTVTISGTSSVGIIAYDSSTQKITVSTSSNSDVGSYLVTVVGNVLSKIET